MTKLTTSHLRVLRACRPQRELFDAVFPGGMELGLENVLLAVSRGLSLFWAVDRLLTPPAREIFLTARAEADYEALTRTTALYDTGVRPSPTDLDEVDATWHVALATAFIEAGDLCGWTI